MFFQEVIDPLSEIFDPFNIILICTLILFININIKRIISNEKKLEVIKKTLNLVWKRLFHCLIFSPFVCKHFILSLALAGDTL